MYDLNWEQNALYNYTHEIPFKHEYPLKYCFLYKH